MNTRNNRASALGICFPSLRVFDNPDNAWSQGDRQQAAYSYRAIAAAMASDFRRRYLARRDPDSYAARRDPARYGLVHV